MKRIVQLLMAGVFVAVGLVVTESSPAQAQPSKPSTDYIDAPWGRAKFVAKRFGYKVRIRVTTDEKVGEEDCVYAKVKLVVDAWFDSEDDHVAHECNASETTTETVWFFPSAGTGFDHLEISLCQPDWFSDSCKTETMPVLQNRGEHTGLRRRAVNRMTEPMPAFQRARANTSGPWVWKSDGCSGPAVRKTEFRNACERHDFGYRNFGHGKHTIRPRDGMRARIDSWFLDDMRRICERRHNGDAEDDCRTAAYGNFLGVREGGSRPFYGQA